MDEKENIKLIQQILSLHAPLRSEPAAYAYLFWFLPFTS